MNILKSSPFLGFLLFFSLFCYSPVNITGPNISEQSVNLPRKKIPGLKLHVFNTGMNKVSPLLVGSPAPWRPAPAFLIEHPRQGLILFDCGLGAEIAGQREGALHPITRMLFKTRSRKGANLAAQMQGAGFNPEQVRTVLLSHLHFDHTGDAPLFKQAKFYLGKATNTKNVSRMDGLEPRHFNWIKPEKLALLDFSAAAPYGIFKRALDLFGDGSLIVIAGDGHAPGSFALLLNLPAGPVLLAGDEVVHFDWLASNDVQHITKDGKRSAEFRNRLRFLMKKSPKLVVVPGHDLSRLPGGREDLKLHNPEMFKANFWPLD